MSNPSFGNGPGMVARYTMIEKTCIWRVYLQTGATGASPGNGNYSVILPHPTLTAQVVGNGWIYGINGFMALEADGSPGRLIKSKDGTYLTHVDGFNQSGQVLAISGTYELG